MPERFVRDAERASRTHIARDETLLTRRLRRSRPMNRLIGIGLLSGNDISERKNITKLIMRPFTKPINMISLWKTRRPFATIFNLSFYAMPGPASGHCEQ